MKVEIIAECSWSIRQYFWPASSDNWYLKPTLGFFKSGRFIQVLRYVWPIMKVTDRKRKRIVQNNMGGSRGGRGSGSPPPRKLQVAELMPRLIWGFSWCTATLLHSGESHDFRILKNGGFLSKPLDSGKSFFIFPLILIRLARGLK